MKTQYVYMLLFLVLALLFSACVSTSSEPEIVATRLAQAPPPTNPPAPLTPPTRFDLAEGAELYQSSCAPCHGETGLGDGATASAFTCPMPAFALAAPDADVQAWFEIAFNGKGNDPSCLMPPWSGRLNAAQIWNTVAYSASLRHDPSLQEQGAALLTAKQSGADTSYLAATAWQIENTDAEILAALAANTLAGFDLSDLTAGDQQAALVYIRSLAYGDAPAPGEEVAQQPAPIATEEAEQAAPTTPEEPAPIATEEAEQAAPANAQTFTITGTVTNGTVGASLPDDLRLSVRVASLDAAGQPFDLYNAETTTDANGGYTFVGVPRDERSIAVVQAQYAGIRQVSEQIFPAAVQGDTLQLPFTIYETTTDPSAIALVYVENLVDAVSAENSSLVFQTVEFSNTGDRIYIGQEGRTLAVSMPNGALNVEMEAVASSATRFVAEQNGDQVIFYDTAPVYPGVITRLASRYNLPYSGSMQVTQAFPYAVQEWRVYVSKTRGLELQSDQLTYVEDGVLSDITYAGYGTSASLPANTALNYTVRDGATARSDAATPSEEGGSFVQENTTLILGIGVLLILAGGMFLMYDLQRKRLSTQSTSSSLPNNQNALIAALATLDDAYEAGEIEESRYLAQRDELKAKLREVIKK